MARQRINPEGTPDRVFQPVAAPVNLYYQPNLSQVPLSRTAQILDALKEFNPKLERFTSDIVAVGIQKERELGALEATSGSLDAANAKAAQAIEKAGGLTPWRYETFLDTLGRRAVREKYQAWLYQNADDLSAIANPDGTLRGPEYAQQKMAEAYQEQVASQFGAGSFFAARAAADERFKIDSQFMPSLQARHAELLKEQNLKDAKDEMFAILSSHSTMSLLPTVDDGRDDSFVKEQIKGVMEQYRRVTGTSGAKPFTDALLEWANSQANDGDFEGALTTLRAFETEDGKFRVMGVELGAAFGAQIKQSIDGIEEKRSSEKMRDLRTNELMAEDVRKKASALVHVKLMEMAKASPTGSLTITQRDAYEMAQAAVDSMPAGAYPDGYRETLIAELATDTFTKAQALNTPAVDNQDAIASINQMIQAGMPVHEIDRHLNQYQTEGKLRQGTRDALYAKAGQEEVRNNVLPGYQASSKISTNDFGLPMESITPSERSEVLTMLGAAQIDLAFRIDAGWEAVMAIPEGPQRAKAAADLINKSKREVLAEFKESHKDLIERADMRRSKDNVLTSKPIEGYIQASSEFVGATINIDGAEPKQRLKAEQWINNRVRAVFGEELDRLLKGGMAPDAARREIEINTRTLTGKVLEEVENPANPNVPEYVRKLADSANRLDTGAREPTEAEAKAGAQSGLAGVVQEMSKLRREVPGISIGLDWVDRTIVPAIGELERQVEEAKSKAQKGAADAPQALEKAKRSISAIANYSIESVFKMQTREAMASPKTVPMYIVRDGSVFMWNENSRQYERNQQMTDNISRLRGISGYSIDEIRAGSSKEGIKIDYARMDPAKDLLVQSGDDMLALTQEYVDSEGKSGVLVDWIQSKISTGQPVPSLDQVLDSQHRLLRQRVPNFTKPLSQFTK